MMSFHVQDFSDKLIVENKIRPVSEISDIDHNKIEFWDLKSDCKLGLRQTN